MLAAAAGRIEFLNFGYDANHLLAAYVSDYSGHGGPRDPVPGAHVTILGQSRPTATESRKLLTARHANLAGMRALPGVVAATGLWQSGLSGDVRVERPGGTEPVIPTQYSASVYFVDPDFLRTMGIRPTAGRDFHSVEDGALPSMVVDEEAARWLWPGSSAVGHLVHFGPTNNGQPWVRVVGVIPSLMLRVDCGINEPCKRPLLLIADDERFAAPPSLGEYIIRTRGEPAAQVARLTPLLEAANPGRPVRLTTWGVMTGLDDATVTHDFVATLFSSFAAIGLLLALIGVYGVAAYGVERRAREFGVRIALGARTADIVRMVLRDGNATALLGLAVGLLLANWGEQFIARFLFGFDDLEPYFLAASVIALFVATVAAGLPAALRASRVDPVETLRTE